MNNDDLMRQILTTSKTVASVGLSSNPAKESYGIVQYLISQGYDMIPVNPGAGEILGARAYPDLLSIPRQVDVVQVFRRPEDVPRWWTRPSRSVRKSFGCRWESATRRRLRKREPPDCS